MYSVEWTMHQPLRHWLEPKGWCEKEINLANINHTIKYSFNTEHTMKILV